jgi:hypothetical protein
MGNTYNYRIGLIIQRDSYIDTIGPEDMVNLYRTHSKLTFDSIFLNDTIFYAYGFIKSYERDINKIYYTRNGILVARRPFTNKYYCMNLPASDGFYCLHELQNLYEIICPLSRIKSTKVLQVFVARYGSKYLEVWDA